MVSPVPMIVRILAIPCTFGFALSGFVALKALSKTVWSVMGVSMVNVNRMIMPVVLTMPVSSLMVTIMVLMALLLLICVVVGAWGSFLIATWRSFFIARGLVTSVMRRRSI